MRSRLLDISPNDPCVTERYVGTQLRALRALGWEVTAVHSSRGEPHQDVALGDIPVLAVPADAIRTPKLPHERAGKVVRTILRRNSEQASEAELRRWAGLVDEVRPDIIFVQFGPVAARILPVLVKSGRPWVVQFHGYDVTQRCQHWGYRLTLATLLRSAHAAFACSTFLTEEVRRHISPQDRVKVHTVTPGYDASVHVPQQRGQEHTGPLRIVSVARLVEVKGHRHAIEAVARAGPDFRLSIIGGGELRADLEAFIADRGVADRVVLEGEKPPSAVRQAFAEADAFIQLSTTATNGAREGLGLSPIEAAASGLPIVVSDSGGLGETCRDGVTGRIVPEADPQAAADALKMLRDNRTAARRMGEAGAKWVAAKYASGVQAARADAVLTSLLSGRRRRDVVAGIG